MISMDDDCKEIVKAVLEPLGMVFDDIAMLTNRLDPIAAQTLVYSLVRSMDNELYNLKNLVGQVEFEKIVLESDKVQLTNTISELNQQLINKDSAIVDHLMEIGDLHEQLSMANEKIDSLSRDLKVYTDKETQLVSNERNLKEECDGIIASSSLIFSALLADANGAKAIRSAMDVEGQPKQFNKFIRSLQHLEREAAATALQNAFGMPTDLADNIVEECITNNSARNVKMLGRQIGFSPKKGNEHAS